MSAAREALLGCAAAVFSILSMATAAHAQDADDPTTRANHLAYEASMRCFEANVLARSDAVDTGKKALAASFDDKAKRSFNAVMKLGGALGYTGSRIQEDFDRAQANELPKLVQDPTSFRTTTATCKALGLM